MAVLANQQQATAGLLGWRDGVPSFGYGREHEGPPQRDSDVMQIGGLTCRRDQACKRWIITLDDR